ncbi:hypothetical protein Tco_0426659, partial [Tanacetum coccineum]
VDNTDKTRRP